MDGLDAECDAITHERYLLLDNAVNQSRVYEAPIGGTWSGSQCSVWLGCYMVVDYRAIQCDGNLQMLDLGRPIEKLPVLVCFDLVIPANTGDRVTPR